MNFYAIIITAALSVLVFWAYIKSPTLRDKVRLTLTIIFIPISAGTIWFTDVLWNYIVLTDPTTIWRLAIIPFFAVIFILIATFFVFLVSWVNEGSLNKYVEGGLVRTLVNGLTNGLIGVIMSGIFFGAVFEMTNPKNETITEVLSWVYFAMLIIIFLVRLNNWTNAVLFGGAIIATIGVLNSEIINGLIVAMIITLSITFATGIFAGIDSERKIKSETIGRRCKNDRNN